MSNGSVIVGIIANPSSGKDIRRLVALGLSVSNNDKVNIVRRVFAGLAATGVTHVLYMPDSWGISARAAQFAPAGLTVEPLPMVCLGVPSDSEEAALRLADLGAGSIVTLGGDGTNRVVVRGCGAVPLMAVSTGTNNVFPLMVEGTLAGLAAGAVASGAATVEGGAVRQMPVLRIAADGGQPDMALIDAVSSPLGYVGARAVWKADDIAAIALSRIVPAAIGMASFGSALFPAAADSGAGAFITFDQTSKRRVAAPLAPGSVVEAGVGSARLLEPGETVLLHEGPCTIALDGEREIELFERGSRATATLDPNGPNVVQLEAAIGQAALAGAFSRATAPEN
ncbi:MAG: NAD(+)/NADH kinase [Thermomicrobiales bacterium]